MFKIGDVVYCYDGLISGVGVIDYIGGQFPNYRVKFDKEGLYLHRGGMDGEPKSDRHNVRYFGLTDIKKHSKIQLFAEKLCLE